MAETTLSEKINAAMEFLKQPSTIKGLIAAAGAVGYAIDQTKLLDILGGVAALIAIINLFYDANPRKSVPVTPDVPAPPTVGADQVAELVRVEIARLRAAQKAKVNGQP